MTITYQVRNAIYVNLTNRCPCACTFCLRTNGPGVYGSDSLWLEREPTVEEAIATLLQWDFKAYPELVFCGYGEPTERLDDLLAIARHVREHYPWVKIRVNTNGLADLIAGAPTVAKCKGLVDIFSISLNTPDPAEYLAICRPKFGEAAYPAMLKFAEDAHAAGIDVVMTVVDEPVTSKGKQAECRAICDRLGVRLRVRPFEA